MRGIIGLFLRRCICTLRSEWTSPCLLILYFMNYNLSCEMITDLHYSILPALAFSLDM